MDKTIRDIQFLGEPPDIVGQVCSGLVVQHFYDGGSIKDQANVTHFKFSDTWHRIYFETGAIFWRAGQAPEQPVNSTLEHGLVLNDLSELPGIAGSTLSRIDYQCNEVGDVDVVFEFDSGRNFHLHYSCTIDTTQVEVN